MFYRKQIPNEISVKDLPIFIRPLALAALLLAAGCASGLQPYEQARIERVRGKLFAAAGTFCQHSPISPGGEDLATTIAPAAETTKAENGIAPAAGLGFSIPGRPAPGAASVAPHTDPANPEPPSETTAPCDITIHISGQRTLSAKANRQRIRVNRGLIEFFGSDDELAFVLAHEMSHLILAHADRLDEKDRRDLELEADYLGLYILARAGFDTSQAIGGVHRLYGTFSSALKNHPHYPPEAVRFAALRASKQEIDDKQARGETLLPEQAAFRAKQRRAGDALAEAGSQRAPHN